MVPNRATHHILEMNQWIFNNYDSYEDLITTSISIIFNKVSLKVTENTVYWHRLFNSASGCNTTPRNCRQCDWIVADCWVINLTGNVFYFGNLYFWLMKNQIEFKVKIFVSLTWRILKTNDINKGENDIQLGVALIKEKSTVTLYPKMFISNLQKIQQPLKIFRWNRMHVREVARFRRTIIHDDHDILKTNPLSATF